MLLNIILRLLHSISITLKAKRFKNGVVFHSLARSIFDDADTMLPIRDILLRFGLCCRFLVMMKLKTAEKKTQKKKENKLMRALRVVVHLPCIALSVSTELRQSKDC